MSEAIERLTKIAEYYEQAAAASTWKSAKATLAQMASDIRQLLKKHEPLANWTLLSPTESGWYWHWNGDFDCAPVPTSVLWSGTTGKCFVTLGQLGLTHPIDCHEYGGWWMPLQEPMVPR